jgi:hypothetical protein
VRRLTGLVARAKPGSALERWLIENVQILQIDQVDGRSVVKSTALTPQDWLDVMGSGWIQPATGGDYHFSTEPSRHTARRSRGPTSSPGSRTNPPAGQRP